jgi:O-antigen/teichoic acid export membrane protein
MASQTKKLTIDTGALLFGRVVGLTLGLVRLQYLALYLGLEHFGILNGALYFTSLFQPLFDIGLSTLLTREMARSPERGRELLGRVLILKSLLGIVASLVIIAMSLLLMNDPLKQWAVCLTTISMAITSMGSAYLGAFQAHRKMVVVSIMSMLSDIGLSVAVILLLPHAPGLHTVLLLSIGAAVLNLGLLVLVYRYIAAPPLLRGNAAAWPELLRQGLPIALGSAGSAVYMYVSPLALQHFRGDAELGIYSAGYKVISILLLIPTVLTQVLYPLFAEFSVAKREKLNKALRDAVRITAMISIPLAVGTLILAPSIVRLLYPPAYVDAGIVLRLIITGNAFGYVAWIFFAFLLAIGHQRFCMWNALAVAAAAAGASLLLVPHFGYIAAAGINGGIDIVLFLSLALRISNMGFPMHYRRLVPGILASALVMGIAVWLARDWYLPASIMLGVATYAAMLLATRSLGDQEREMIRTLIQR